MGDRELNPTLAKLKENGIETYSISKLDTINNCMYGAYRTYKLHDRGKNNIYALLGTKVHDTLEGIVNGQNTETDLLPAIRSELDDCEMFGYEFPKDRKGEDSIKNGWVTDMEHFAKTYNSPRGNNLKTEDFFLYKTEDGHHLIGYIDLQRVNKDGTLDIYDYKTSSMYSKEGFKEHGRQLVVYALGKQQEGFDVKRVAWIFLKFVDVKFLGYKTSRSKEKTEITKTIERKNIGKEMAKYVERDLSDFGYDDLDSNFYISEFMRTNDFSVLPEKIRSNYKMIPCTYYYDLSEENIEDCKRYIKETIIKWETATEFPPKSFTRVQKNGKEVSDIFFCTNLCGHFENCSYIQDYLDQLDTNKDEDDLF